MAVQNKRRYFGEETAAPLVKWLNTARGESLALIERLLAAAARRRSVSEPVTRQRSDRMLRVLHTPAPVAREIRKMPPSDTYKQGQSATFQEATVEINSILRQVGLTPQLFATVRGRWIIRWCGQGVSGSEAGALFKLLELGSLGLLHRVMQCANPKCARWLYAAPPHKRFHSIECQMTVYESDPDRKEARREWMRNYYRNNFTKEG
jgi:hypothetical protein